MKFVILFLISVAATCFMCCPQFEDTPLEQSEDDCSIMKMVPFGRIPLMLAHAYKVDPEVRKSIDYMHSEEVKQIIQDFQESDEYKRLIEFFQNSSVQLIKFASTFKEMFNNENQTHKEFDMNLDIDPSVTGKPLGGMKKVVENIITSIHWQELYKCTMKSDSQFKDLQQKFQSQEFIKIIKDLRSNKDWIKLVAGLEKHDLPVNDIIDNLMTILQSF